MYHTINFMHMVNDRRRTEAFVAAIRATVRPGDRVVDLGCGFGFFSVVACQAGAAHVDAIDVNPVVAMGPRVAAANGCADRITFHHADGARVALAERADVLISDLRGAVPAAGNHFAVVRSVRDRLLKPGGRIIAARDSLWVAPVVASATFREHVLAPSAAAFVNVEPVQFHLTMVPYKTTVLPEHLLGAPVQWTSMDYAGAIASDLDGAAELVIARDGTLEALAIWFDMELAPGITLSNAPGTETASYRQLLLPLSKAVQVRAGDRLHVALSAHWGEQAYLWRWRGTRAEAPGDVLFDQNSLVETVLDASLLAFGPDTEVPSVGPHAEALQWLLARMSAKGTVRAIAAEARARWPDRYPSARDALRWVQRTVQQLDREENGIE